MTTARRRSAGRMARSRASCSCSTTCRTAATSSASSRPPTAERERSAPERARRAQRGRAGEPVERRLRGDDLARAAHAAQRDPRLVADDAQRRRLSPESQRRAARSDRAQRRYAGRGSWTDLLDVSRIVSREAARSSCCRSTCATVIEHALERSARPRHAKGLSIDVRVPEGPLVDPRGRRRACSRWSGTCCRTPSSSRRQAAASTSRSRARRIARRNRRDATTGSASGPTSCRTCSTASARPTPPPRAASVASASASRS